MEDVVYTDMVGIAAEVGAQIIKCEAPGLCYNSPVPGPVAVMDRVGKCPDGANSGNDGQGWVRLTTEYPSDLFPAATQDAENCAVPLAYTLEVGIARSIHVGTSSQLGGILPPTMIQQIGDTRRQVEDARIIRDAIRNYLNRAERTFTLGAYLPMQLTGDVGGGYWLVTIWEM